MSPIAQAALASWAFPPAIVILLLGSAAVYARGFRQLHLQMPDHFPGWRLAAFLAGLATILVAITSPLDAFGGLLLQVHMVQHLLLMFVAPPLLLLGAPTVPLLRGLPGALAKDALGPFLAWTPLRRLGEALTHPVVCWLALVVVSWGWHVPSAYQLALRSPAWHEVEHACFIGAALLFWWPVVQPWPSRARWPRWAMVPYLLLADVQNTAFSAFFTFSDRLIYPFYAAVPRLGGISALDDQIAAGAIMWVPASLVVLIPGALIVANLLSPQNPSGPRRAAREDGRSIDLTRSTSAPGQVGWHTELRRRPLDLLEVALIGRVLRWQRFRPMMQGLMLLLAGAVVVDGLVGPQVSPMNLAGVLPWTYWRGLTVVAILALGNLFCLACPFMLPRKLARRLGLARLRWPGRLRSKWFAVALLVGFLWAYEVFALWDSPWWTAWLIVGYFSGALVVDGLFQGASFCKYVCPIGQFHFIHSLMSPFEVKVRSPQACAGCATQDCLRGNERQRGCELELLLPRKVGNLDCTFCLDCIHACPHDNIGILAVSPGGTLADDSKRSSLGRLSQRADVAALAMVLVFAAFASAAAMVVPVTVWQQQVRAWLGLSSTKLVVSTMLLLALLVVPPMVCGLAAAIGRAAAGIRAPARELRHRFVLGLVPLGLSMWAAHFLFHLLSGIGSAVPVVERVLADLGYGLATPRWTHAGMTMNLLGVEILLLDAGLLLTLYVGWRIATGYATRARAAIALLAPWVVVSVGLYLGGVWTFLQPMQMRGMLMHPPPGIARIGP